MVARSSKGRQVIPLIKIVSETARATSYSKRKSSLLKKANALCTLTGAKMALIINTPGSPNKPFSFGHPSVGEIVDELLMNNRQHIPEKTRDFLSRERNKNLNGGLNELYEREFRELCYVEGLRDEAARVDRAREERRYKRPLEEMEKEMVESFSSDLAKLSINLGKISGENKMREAQFRRVQMFEAKEREDQRLRAQMGIDGNGFMGFVGPSVAHHPRAFQDGSSSSNNVMPLGTAPFGSFGQPFDNDFAF